MSRRTINNSVRLSPEDNEDLSFLAAHSRLTKAQYLRKLVKADIERAKRVKRGPDDHGVELDIAVALATLLQIAGQQDEEVQIEISEKANPILRKISELFIDAKTQV